MLFKTLGIFVLFFYTLSVESVQLKFKITATIPDNIFYVSGDRGMAQTQRMVWNEDHLSFNTLSKQFVIPNLNDGIKAYLLEDALLRERSNLSYIPLSVFMHDKKISVGSDSATVVTKVADVSEGKFSVINITQTKKYTKKTRPPAGDYHGIITMIFDNIPYDDFSYAACSLKQSCSYN